DPESEPSPSQIATITDIVDEHGITTVFTEPLMPEETAETIAAETGAKVRVLDPLEGITDQSPGDDYPSIMRGNLATLTEALECTCPRPKNHDPATRGSADVPASPTRCV